VLFVNRKLLTILLLVACSLAIGTSLWGQDAAAAPGIQGYLNPRTGVFHSIRSRPPLDAAEPPATTTFTGTLVVNFTITVSSAIPATQQIGCVAGASFIDNSIKEIVDLAGTAVTRGTGSTVTCSVTVPYSWTLATASTDSVVIGYSITSPVNFSTPAGEWPHHALSTTLVKIKVPASGTTTTENVAARL
jgi:hypothetical protein